MKQILTLLLCLVCASAQADKLVTYPAPQGAELNNDFDISVRTPGGQWQHVDAYAWKVDKLVNCRHTAMKSSVAYFDFEGTVEVEVKSLRQPVIDSCLVRPLSYNIPVSTEGNTIRFTLDRPRDLSIEVNGEIFHNLQLFANGMEPKVKKGKDVIYFGPGYYDLKDDSILVTSGKTLYVAGGAYIKGFASVWKAKNVKVVGHGIINPERQCAGLRVRYSSNVAVDGIITTQIPVGGSDSVSVANSKVISWYGWGDGMNVFASNNVSYNHVFCRTSDDCSTIYCTRLGYKGGCSNIRIKDAVYWADVAHPIMIGLHGDIGRNEMIEDVVYEDVDILDHAEKQIDYQGCIAINNGDNILVRNITFRNIRIENFRQGMLFNFRVCYNKKYCQAPGRGIRDIRLENITYNGAHSELSLLTGYSPDRTIENISFRNLVINGTLITDTMPGKPAWYKTADMACIFVGEHVSGITFSK